MKRVRLALPLRMPAGPMLALLASGVIGQASVGQALPVTAARAGPSEAGPALQPLRAAAPPPGALNAAAAAPVLNLALLQREGPRPEVADVFAGRSWAPPPAPEPPPPASSPPAAPAAAPEPTAPPLPFSYVGKLAEEGGPTTYFLERGPQVLAIAAGEAIDAQYLLAEASPGELAFVYLPLQTRQVLRLPP